MHTIAAILATASSAPFKAWGAFTPPGVPASLTTFPALEPRPAPAPSPFLDAFYQETTQRLLIAHI